MSRWEPNARGRMVVAALELFDEQGFDKTTAGDIAARAGVTERTFFRHFADKREVLFDGATGFLEATVKAVAEAPSDASALEAALAGARAAAELLDEARRAEGYAAGEAREFSVRRARIIAATPALQERELLKMAAMTTDTVAALARRGIGEPAATLAAHSATAVFQTAFTHWISVADRSFPECVDEAAKALRDLT